ncbi:MAG: YgjP-like metallopeptidase domain-containing protein [Candidatus Paceibacterota bacterium]
MQKIVSIDGVDMPYTIKSNSKSRKISLRIQQGGHILVTKPTRVSVRYIEGVVDSKKDWIAEQINKLGSKPAKLLAHYSAKDLEVYRDEAYNLVDAKIAHFNKFYKFEIERVTIRNQSTRWGSCSRQKNLNFNYKIVLLPSKLQDYIIVHELCHLSEMNHGKKFWDLVSLQIPDYKDCVKSLKDY